jgi:Gas vesicle protein
VAFPSRAGPARPPDHRQVTTNLADILERVLDKGIVIAGDIRVNLLDVELLTIKIRLLVASVDKAREMGIDWWEHDPTLFPGSVTSPRRTGDCGIASAHSKPPATVRTATGIGVRAGGKRRRAGRGVTDTVMYLYAVADADLRDAEVDGLRAVDDGPIHIICEARVAAVVSAADAERFCASALRHSLEDIHGWRTSPC